MSQISVLGDVVREDVVRLLKGIRSRPRRKVHEVKGLRISWTSVRAPRRAFNPVICIEGDGEPFIGSFDEAVDRLLVAFGPGDAMKMCS